jgi:hypothetical protein
VNEAFSTLLTANIEALVADLSFTYKPDGSMKAPQVVETCLPAKEQGYQEGQEVPLVRWIIYKGAFSWRTPSPFNVRIDAGIYTPGSIVEGTRDIQSLCLALGRLVEKPWYSPYKLANRIPFNIGDPQTHSEGSQAHPYYWASLYLEFKVANGHGG